MRAFRNVVAALVFSCTECLRCSLLANMLTRRWRRPNVCPHDVLAPLATSLTMCLLRCATIVMLLTTLKGATPPPAKTMLSSTRRQAIRCNQRRSQRMCTSEEPLATRAD